MSVLSRDQTSPEAVRDPDQQPGDVRATDPGRQMGHNLDIQPVAEGLCESGHPPSGQPSILLVKRPGHNPRRTPGRDRETCVELPEPFEVDPWTEVEPLRPRPGRQPIEVSEPFVGQRPDGHVRSVPSIRLRCLQSGLPAVEGFLMPGNQIGLLRCV